MGVYTMMESAIARYRDQALLKFKRYYFHGLRNLLDSDVAAAQAHVRTRSEITTLMQSDPVFKTHLDIEEAWADVLYILLTFQSLLMNIPIDKEKIGPASPPTSVDLEKKGDSI